MGTTCRGWGGGGWSLVTGPLAMVPPPGGRTTCRRSHTGLCCVDWAEEGRKDGRNEGSKEGRSLAVRASVALDMELINAAASYILHVFYLKYS